MSSTPQSEADPTHQLVAAPTRDSSLRRGARVAANSATILAACLFAAEITSRLDDWIRFEAPLAAAPDRMRDLQVWEGGLVRGRPNGRHEKWKLNRYGFRGGDMTRLPSPDTTRVLVLGASESFGLYESEGKEYPARLNAELRGLGRYEVVNAAMPGMTVATMISYWERWARHFRPDVVVIYPTPFLYLNFTSPPKKLTAAELDRLPPLDPDAVTVAPPLPELSSRLVHRLRQAVDLPETIQAWRDARTVEELIADKPRGWLLQSAPEENLDWLMADLADLISAIERRGATAIVLTHPIRCTQRLTPQDVQDLERLRVHNPRATPAAIVAFEIAVRERLLAQGRGAGWTIIDLAESMSGKPALFADPVHLTDAGAQIVASTLARRIHEGVVQEVDAR